MRIGTFGGGLLVGTLALSLSAAPASAEMFTCHDKPGQVLYSYKGTPSDYRGRNYSRRRTTDDYAAHTRYYRADSSHASYYGSRRSWDEPSR
jgi:hypothetical protein